MKESSEEKIWNHPRKLGHLELEDKKPRPTEIATHPQLPTARGNRPFVPAAPGLTMSSVIPTSSEGGGESKEEAGLEAVDGGCKGCSARTRRGRREGGVKGVSGCGKGRGRGGTRRTCSSIISRGSGIISSGNMARIYLEYFPATQLVHVEATLALTTLMRQW